MAIRVSIAPAFRDRCSNALQTRVACIGADEVSGRVAQPVLLFAPDCMPEYVEIARTSELQVGQAKACVVGGQTIALYRTAGGFFATDNTCPHRGGPLAEGDLIGNEINCPWHLWSFDVETGICAGNSEVSVPTFELRLEGERILVRIP
jgi:nitrite reductase (NADH) small subunit